MCEDWNENLSWRSPYGIMRLEVGAQLNWFKPSSKIFYWPFEGGTSLMDLFLFFLSCVCWAFVCVCLYVPCGHLLGKSWPLGSRLWCLAVSLALSHWYPGSGVVLDCIDSWSLHPYLLCKVITSVMQRDGFHEDYPFWQHKACRAGVLNFSMQSSQKW